MMRWWTRIKYKVAETMSAKKFTKTDFDVWIETSELTKELWSLVLAKWVKQDKHIKGVYAGVGPIHINGKFHKLMDR